MTRVLGGIAVFTSCSYFGRGGHYSAIYRFDWCRKGWEKFDPVTRIWLIGQDIETVQRFTDTIQALPEVVECHLMVGDCDFLLKIVVSNIEEYRQLQIKHLKRENSVQNIKTEIPMQKIKQTSAVPLD